MWYAMLLFFCFMWYIVFLSYYVCFSRDKIRDSYSDFYKAFCKYDTQNRGSLSVDDIQKVLIEQNFYITDDEFFLLLDM